MAEIGSRSLVNIGISPAASRALDEMADDGGMKKGELCSRVVLWLSRISPDARKAIIASMTPAAEAVVLRFVIEGIDSEAVMAGLQGAVRPATPAEQAAIRQTMENETAAQQAEKTAGGGKKGSRKAG